MSTQYTLQVVSIRSQNPMGFGGCIFTAKLIDATGHIQDATGHFVVKATFKVLGGCRVEPGQWWRVSGEVSKRIIEINGYRLTELQIEASDTLLTRPSGDHIVSYLTDSPVFTGIGIVKARKLWNRFGEDLYTHLDAGDTATLAAVLSTESAKQVIKVWTEQGDSRTLQWLQANGFNIDLGRRVVAVFGQHAAERLGEDPYRLLSFGGSWRLTDALALDHFRIAPDDQRRLQAAVEEVCYRAFDAGHTYVPSSMLMGLLQNVLGPETLTVRWKGLIDAAVSKGLSNGSFVIGPHGFQPLAAMVMERQIAQAVASRLLSTPPCLMPKDQIDKEIKAYEVTEGLELNVQQRQAVYLAAVSPLCLITGGAGVGKTTVLKAIYGMYSRVGVAVTQLALAGRAAKRMQEATGHPASTIANFLCNRPKGGLPERSVVVVDEASMVDVVTMSRLCEALGPKTRILLLGDTSQLMPVGPGLLLHVLVKTPRVPRVELTVVKRFAGMIARAAASIREGVWPVLPSNPDAPIAFIQRSTRRFATAESSLSETVLSLYCKDPKNTQILCARKSRADGNVSINILCQSALTAKSAPVHSWDLQSGAPIRVGFNLGDPVLCTRNLWIRGLQNGSLGVVVKVEAQAPVSQYDDALTGQPVLAWVDWDDGIRRPIVQDMLDDLELGYAITIHKAQGSQWPRVVVPLTGNRLLDRTLIYTAVTRAKNQVLLVGDKSAVKAAVEAAPRSKLRQVALGLHLSTLIS